MCVGHHVKYPFFLSDFNDTWIFRQIFFFQKYSNMKFHENPSSGSGAVPWGRAYGQTDMTKSVVAFRNFVNAPKTRILYWGTALSHNLMFSLSPLPCKAHELHFRSHEGQPLKPVARHTKTFHTVTVYFFPHISFHPSTCFPGNISLQVC